LLEAIDNRVPEAVEHFLFVLSNVFTIEIAVSFLVEIGKAVEIVAFQILP
jgi:hypothetical protein